MKVNISQAAKLAGKSRGTLYKHIKQGKITTEKDELDNPVIDVAELNRVYGLDPEQGEQSKNVHNEQSSAPEKQGGDTHKIELLELKLAHFEKELQTSEERRAMAEKQVTELTEIVKKQTYMLAAPKEEAEAQQEPSKKSFWGRLFGS